MEVIRSATEDEMILEFLQAEVDGDRWTQVIHDLLRGDVTCITAPNPIDIHENTIRRLVLAIFRGYGMNNLLFEGFPVADIHWFRAVTTRKELENFRYANYQPLLAVSGATRRVDDAAARLDKVVGPDDMNARVAAIERDLARGKVYPDLIAVAEKVETGHVLVGGHSRATAFCQVLPDDAKIEVIVGHSPQIGAWRYW